MNQFGTSLTYSPPVDSDFASFSFIFDICQNDLNILLSDDYRYSVIEIIVHTLLQRSTIKGNDDPTQENFNNFALDTLHSKHDHLRVFIVVCMSWEITSLLNIM